jgi:type IV pilus assembly protein PilB
MPPPGTPPNTPSAPNANESAPRVRIGELLVQSRALTQERLAEALALQKSEHDAGRPRRLGQLLVEKGFVDETQMTQILGRQLAVPWVSLYHVDFSRQLLNLVPREVAEAFTIVPVYVRHVRGQGDTLYVATDDPTNSEGLDRVAAYAALPVRPMISSATDIRAAIRVYYGGGAGTVSQPKEPVAAGATPNEPPPPPPSSDQPSEQQPSTMPAKRHTREGREEPLPPTSPEAPRAIAGHEQQEQVKVRVVDAAIANAPATAGTLDTGKAPPDARSAPAAKKLEVVAEDDAPEIEAHTIPAPPKRKGRAIALTFLDGTTINLPAPRAIRRPRPSRDSAPPSEPTGTGEDELTARDLVAALRAVSHGVDASEILGDNPRWEKMFAALLSLLLRKHLIADWEFVEEYRKI